MRVGLVAHWPGTGMDVGLDDLIRRFERAESDGFASAWSAHIRAYDALTVLALAGRVTSSIELGTSVVPTYPRHPAALAQQALTVQAATGNRLTLGIGPSHPGVIEGMLGLDYSRPIRHMREYLGVLTRVLSGEATAFQGKEYRVQIQITVADATPPSILVAGLGPQMLKLTGTLADGTITAFGGPRYLGQVAVPQLRAAAAAAGRPAPRVAAIFPVAVTDQPDRARAAAAETFARYPAQPSYRRNLDIEGSEDATGGMILGNETQVSQQFQRLAQIGVTDLLAAPFPIRELPRTVERTYECLRTLAKSAAKVGC